MKTEHLGYILLVVMLIVIGIQFDRLLDRVDRIEKEIFK